MLTLCERCKRVIRKAAHAARSPEERAQIAERHHKLVEQQQAARRKRLTDALNARRVARAARKARP